jgi:glycosyltransferase involved in cell wall biosynthesis
LALALAGVARQTVARGQAPVVEVVVVDNEGDPRVGEIVRAFAAESGLTARCATEPRRGISQARNAALAMVPADTDFVAFIDDDEVPSPGWLAALLETQRRTGAAVVCGPVVPSFEAAPPRWVEDGGFFHQPRRPALASGGLADGAPVADASTNNALVRVAEMRRGGARFHEDFALTGGEDAVFFAALAAQGAGMVWSPAAWVSEHVPVSRATFAYLAREFFRCGNVRAAIEAMDPQDPGSAVGGRRRAAATSAKKALKKASAQTGPLLAALARGRGRAQVYAHLFELANAAGRIAYLFGYRYAHYR